MKKYLLLLIALLTSDALAQSPTGANHPELSWYEIETPHFTIVYHNGLDSVAREAAPIAEEVYHVVTTNLHNPLDHKVKIYLSDNDEIKNAFAMKDDHIFVWMRSILDDLPFAIRSSGTSKWLRSVLTHEFTHSVIFNATKDLSDVLIPIGGVPRWFNEGMARFMEPDGWTTDLDMVLRVATVSSKLNFNLDEFMGGTLMYEGGQSVVRYIAATYGDSALHKILHHRTGLGFYDFTAGVQAATKHSIEEIFDDWRRTMNVYYNTQYGQKQETKDIARKIPTGLPLVITARASPDGKHIVMFGKRSDEAPAQFYMMDDDSLGRSRVILDAPGFDSRFSWTRDSKSLILSKLRFADHSDLLYDLYRFDIASGGLQRLSDNARLEQPESSPSSDQIIAVQSKGSGSDLVVVEPASEAIKEITHFHDPSVGVYWPRWSPSGDKIAFSIFRKNGMRDVAVLDAKTEAITYLTSDSANDRYTVWSPRGDSLVFISHRNTVPNIYKTGLQPATAATFHQMTDVAGAVLAWDWSSQKDSILVTSPDSRSALNLYWLGPNTSTTNAPAAALAEKYTKWRTVHWPLITRTADSIPRLDMPQATAYNSLAHIQPLILFPLLGSDMDHNGREGTRYGFISLWSDPMNKHLLTGLFDYGGVSKQPSIIASYTNAQLKPTITLNYANVMGFNGIIDDKLYYQRETNVGLGIDRPFFPNDATDRVHLVGVGAAWRRLDPWNGQSFVTTPIERRPVKTTLLSIGSSYAFVSPDFQTSLAYSHADKKLASGYTYSKWRAVAHWQLPLDDEHNAFFGIVGRGLAQFGEEIPQEFIGFTPYDLFQGGFNVVSLQTQDRLRGIRRYIYGNRLIVGSAELSFPDFIAKNIVAPLQAFNPDIVAFIDVGNVWYGSRPANNPNVTIGDPFKMKWLKSYGAELRSTLAPGTWMSGGVAWEWIKRPKPDFYFRISTGL